MPKIKFETFCLFVFVFGNNEKNVTAFLVRLPHIGFLLNQNHQKLKLNLEKSDLQS